MPSEVNAPPENEGSVIYKLWKKHRGKINASRHREIVNRKLVESSRPKEEQIPFTFHEFVQKTAEPSFNVRLC